jgi:hypothetical protein
VKILIGYDGSRSADAAIAAAGELLAGADVQAIVLSVWESEAVVAVRAARFGGPVPAIATDAADDDDRSERRARKLAEQGALLARDSGFDAIPGVWRTTATSRAQSSARRPNSTSTSSCSELAVWQASAHSWEASRTTSSSTPRVPSWSFRRARHRKRHNHFEVTHQPSRKGAPRGYHYPQRQPDRPPARAHGQGRQRLQRP